jgi:hypothetical protein
VVGGAIDQLFMLGADAPAARGFSPSCHRRDQLLTRGDERIDAIGNFLVLMTLSVPSGAGGLRQRES